nr:RNA polymerase sigma factor [Lentibacillus saliphilus]
MIDDYKPIIERFAFQFGVNEASIPDIVQETFIKIHRNIHRYTKGKFSTWVYQITLNVARDHHRKEKRQRSLLEKAKRKHPKQETYYFFENESHVLLHECMQQLNHKYKTALILYYFHDKSYEDIALILNVKLSVVKTRIHRGKKHLKELFEEANDAEVRDHG